MSTPAVLFLIFNRPDTTALVLEAIRTARPPRLYVAADGPRANRPDEIDRCEAARRIATSVDWPCHVETRFGEANLGVQEAVSSAIDWFFESEEEGIVLEDDCLPSAGFFTFCEDLLDRFRDDERVMAVCGSCYAKPDASYLASYYFSYYADMWGWASWRRAWRLYDRELARWPEFKAGRYLEALARGSGQHEAYWTGLFDATRDGRIRSWDYHWIYTVIEQGGLACYPVANLVSNLGWRADATHTVAEPNQVGPVANLPHQKLTFPLIHPNHFARSATLDRKIEAVRLGLLMPAARVGIWDRAARRLLQSTQRVLRSVRTQLPPA
jgi:hypothetical protein